MRLARLEVEGFRRLPDRAFDFVSKRDASPSDLVLITGGPAAGKTTFLEAIIMSIKHLVGPRPPDSNLLRHRAKTGRLVGSWALTDAEVARVTAPAPVALSTSIFGEGSEHAEHPDHLRTLLRSPGPGTGQAVYFHATRLLPPASTSGGSMSELARDWLEATSSKFALLRRHVIDCVLRESIVTLETLRERGVVLGPAELGAHKRLASVVRPFLHGKTFDGVDDFEGRRRVRFREPDGDILDLDQLSGSEKQGVLFALTFEACRLEHAIVLIDMPELHVAPTEQLAFFEAVRALGRGNQVFAATSSPTLLAAVDPTQIVDLSRA